MEHGLKDRVQNEWHRGCVQPRRGMYEVDRFALHYDPSICDNLVD